jgi:hypothetical protein
MSFKPDDPDLLAVASYGRGIYTYRYDDPQPLLCHDKGKVRMKIAKKVQRKRKQRARVKLISTVDRKLHGTVKLKAKKRRGGHNGKLGARPKRVKVTIKPNGKKKVGIRLPRGVRHKIGQGKKVKVTAIAKLRDSEGHKLVVKKSRRIRRVRPHKG